MVLRSYTVGAGHRLGVDLDNPGTYYLSLHGPNGFFRHFAGSRRTAVRVDVRSDDGNGKLTLRLRGDGHRGRPMIVHVTDAYGPGRSSGCAVPTS
jgi:phospholipase C